MSALKQAAKTLKEGYETALKAGKIGGVTVTHATTDEGRVRITVSGDGTAIDKALPVLFPGQAFGVAVPDRTIIHSSHINRHEDQDKHYITVNHHITTY